MKKLRVGDLVRVQIGKDKGREGKIEKLLVKNQTASIPEIGVYKKHVKAQVAVDRKGGIYDVPRPVALAKLILICPHCKKPTRVGFEVRAGTKQRMCKKCHKLIDSAKGKK